MRKTIPYNKVNHDFENVLNDQDDNRLMGEYFMNEKKFEEDIWTDHKAVLAFLHDRIIYGIHI